MQYPERQPRAAQGDSPVDQAHGELGILQAPAGEGLLEAVDREQVGAGEAEVRAAQQPPVAPAPPAAGHEGPVREWQEPVDAAAPALAQPARERPGMGGRALALDAFGVFAREQDAVARQRDAGPAQAGDASDEAGPRDAVAIEEVQPVASAAQGREIARPRQAKAVVRLPGMMQR